MGQSMYGGFPDLNGFPLFAKNGGHEIEGAQRAQDGGVVDGFRCLVVTPNDNGRDTRLTDASQLFHAEGQCSIGGAGAVEKITSMDHQVGFEGQNALNHTLKSIIHILFAGIHARVVHPVEGLVAEVCVGKMQDAHGGIDLRVLHGGLFLSGVLDEVGFGRVGDAEVSGYGDDLAPVVTAVLHTVQDDFCIGLLKQFATCVPVRGYVIEILLTLTMYEIFERLRILEHMFKELGVGSLERIGQEIGGRDVLQPLQPNKLSCPDVHECFPQAWVTGGYGFLH